MPRVYSSPMGAATLNCPTCGASVSSHASNCRYCQS
ncbi:MAG: hypothetical protein H7144_01845, partial [Burkholderiales bacterium]|nr:hypothetical protein [Phycisphaerae bacterium]